MLTDSESKRAREERILNQIQKEKEMRLDKTECYKMDLKIWRQKAEAFDSDMQETGIDDWTVTQSINALSFIVGILTNLFISKFDYEFKKELGD